MSHQKDRNIQRPKKRSRIISPIVKKRPYTAFPGIYDLVMIGARYSLWAQVALEAYQMAGKLGFPPRILDLGCGTCRLWKELPPESELWGIDFSPEMLEVAAQNGIRGNRICADLLNLPKFSEPFDLVICTHDTLNYILSPTELQGVLSSVAKLLSPDGVFFFDASTARNFKSNFEGRTMEEKHGKTRLIWENEGTEDSSILKTTLLFENGKETFEEVHLHRAYDIHTWKQLIRDSGLELMAAGSDYESWEVSPEADYFVFVCKRA
ncbi:methyltransferase [Leptospira perolatii]|uniref:Methyltransferase n=1 Tax=Leptospira perolatii TaxID=2023191 RepID=A0A2M9ZMV1_9LEPT|nr:class I SAM-dependent methyltransferase [Leptospira perolatii]PJZ70132.1 methyltransferase [Leptospira perolatii]PJZ73321.1 methyltransferase [Leptospira perolatii]